MAKLRIGIVGVGTMGRTHVEAFRDVAGAQVVVANDPAGFADIGKQFAAKYELDYEPTLEGLVSRKDIDAVVITTPHALHAQHAILAFEAGKHVLVEKPMEVSLEACDAIIKAADKAGKKLMVAHSHRYWPGDIVGKELIASGTIGQVVMIRDALISSGYRAQGPGWMRDPKLYGPGGHLAWGCHCMDRLRYWLGCDATSVYARQWPLRTEISGDFTSNMMLINFENGACADFWYSEALPEPGWSHAEGYCRAQIVGEKGIIDCNPYSKVMVAREGAKAWETVYELPPDRAVTRQKTFADECRDFARCIINDTEPAVTGLDGKKAVEMCLAAYKSGETGKAVKLPLK